MLLPHLPEKSIFIKIKKLPISILFQ